MCACAHIHTHTHQRCGSAYASLPVCVLVRAHVLMGSNARAHTDVHINSGNWHIPVFPCLCAPVYVPVSMGICRSLMYALGWMLVLPHTRARTHHRCPQVNPFI